MKETKDIEGLMEECRQIEERLEALSTELAKLQEESEQDPVVWLYNEAFKHADPTKNTVRLCLFTQVKTTPVLDSFDTEFLNEDNTGNDALCPDNIYTELKETDDPREYLKSTLVSAVKRYYKFDDITPDAWALTLVDHKTDKYIIVADTEQLRAQVEAYIKADLLRVALADTICSYSQKDEAKHGVEIIIDGIHPRRIWNAEGLRIFAQTSFDGVRRALRAFKPINSVDGEAKLQHVVKGILSVCLVEAEVSMRDHVSLVIVAPDGSRDVRFTVAVSDLAV